MDKHCAAAIVGPNRAALPASRNVRPHRVRERAQSIRSRAARGNVAPSSRLSSMHCRLTTLSSQCPLPLKRSADMSNCMVFFCDSNCNECGRSRIRRRSVPSMPSIPNRSAPGQCRLQRRGSAERSSGRRLFAIICDRGRSLPIISDHSCELIIFDNPQRRPRHPDKPFARNDRQNRNKKRGPHRWEPRLRCEADEYA